MNSNWSYSPETVKLGCDLCDLDLWPWSFAWTSLLSLIITPENFMMMRWWEHSQKGVTDGRTDRQTDRQTENTICRAAWSQLKMWWHCLLGTVILSSAIIRSTWSNMCWILWLVMLACACSTDWTLHQKKNTIYSTFRKPVLIINYHLTW